MADHALMTSSAALTARQSGCFHTSAPFRRSRPHNRCKSICIHALAKQQAVALEAVSPGRRALLLALGSLAAAQALPSHAAKDTAQVGEYLPPSDIPGFVEFVPDRKKTPAIRAGTVDPTNPYRFAMPTSWREQQVANIQSGNYCQPRCAEPWTEVIFADSTEGRAQVLVSPLVRLTNQANATIEDIGDPPGVLNSLGSFITGTYLDDDNIVAAEKTQHDGRTYYKYELNAPYGSVGPHSLTAATTKGDLLLCLIVSANEKQWQKAESKLRTLVDTFRA